MLIVTTFISLSRCWRNDKDKLNGTSWKVLYEQRFCENIVWKAISIWHKLMSWLMDNFSEWLALLILKAGDVESNPGPQNRKLPPSALTTQTTTLNSTTHSHATTSHHNQKLLTLLQLNINSITNKHEELKLLVTELQPDIITIQETKLKKHNKTPQIPTYSAIRTDRANGKGGGLLTYIKHNITFSDTKIPNFINPINTELQIIQLHITNNKIYTIANIYIPPRNTTSADHATCDADITSCIQYITNLPNSIISGDINAHSPIWHSYTKKKKKKKKTLFQ